MKQIRLVLVGFGVVGQGFVELLMTKHDFLKQHYGVDIAWLESLMPGMVSSIV